MAHEALIAALSTDESFRTDFLAAGSFNEAAAIAARKGYVITVADLEALAQDSNLPDGGELSEADLKHVAGGSNGLFGMLNAIVNKFDESAHKVIQKLGQG
jgi:predicted ribosomally synthesized peptide with nif11-like leader